MEYLPIAIGLLIIIIFSWFYLNREVAEDMEEEIEDDDDVAEVPKNSRKINN